MAEMTAEDYYNRAFENQLQGNIQAAITDYTTAIELDSNYDKAYCNRGILYKKIQEWDKALADFDRSIDIMPNEAMYYSNRGWLYKELEQWDQALEDCNKSLELDPEDVIVWTNLNLLYSRWAEQEFTDNGSDSAKQIWQQAQDFAKEKLKNGVDQAKDLYLKATDNINSLGKIEQQKRQQVKVLKQELHKGFSDK